MIATTAHVPAARVPTANRCAALSCRPNQRQMSAERIAGASHGGLPRQALVAGNDRQRDTPHLRGGFTFLTLQSTCRGLRGSGLSHSHRPGFSSLAGRLVAERAFPAALAITNSRALGCRPFRLNRLPHQKLVNAVSDRLHFSNVLSKPCSLAGSNNASKGLQGRGYLTQALGRFSQGSAPND